ncbi:MAG: hypothetical protein ABGY95_07880 [Rubritalea sp.]
MAIQKHDLIHELPEHRDTIHDLKVSNAHFAHFAHFARLVPSGG